MKNQAILKELQEIQRLIGENAAYPWEPNLESTIGAVITEDYNDAGEDEEPDITVYNGWSERLDALTKSVEENASTDLIDRASPLLSYEDYDEMAESVVALTKLEDKNQSLDHSLGENVYPTEQYEHSFTVSSFLNAIGYESN